MTNSSNRYKYGTETFLSMFLIQYQFVYGQDLELYTEEGHVFNESNPCNIYFVLRRSRIVVDPASFRTSGVEASFRFLIDQKDRYDIMDIVMKLDKPRPDLKLNSKYPYNYFTLSDKDGIWLEARPGSFIDSANASRNVDVPELDYEILYIGQAYGKNGERTVFDRLASHSTLQKIYINAMSENPDCEISILLAKFGQKSILWGGPAVDDTQTEKRDDEKVDQFLEEEGLHFSQKQRINLTEAALIKYFEPKYNIEFKNNFPHRRHRSYSEYFNKDVRAFAIELDTSQMARFIYTEKSGRKRYYTQLFDFSKDSDRFGLQESLPAD